MIISHTSSSYKKLNNASRWNGAYYYSKEIVKNIIPRVHTTYNWITINTQECADHSIVFIHNNLHPELYDYLKQYKDLILVVGVPDTLPKVAHLGKAIYLPLSVDVDYVKQFQTEKDRDVCFVGRPNKFDGTQATGDYIGGCSREELLERLAHYKQAYAVGRCAIEAKILGCEVLPYDPRFPDPSVWKVLSNGGAADRLQNILDDLLRRGEGESVIEIKSGERFRTVTEAAEHFGVSLSTVSKSVNEGREVAGLKFMRL